jgi:hypothetical protein
MRCSLCGMPLSPARTSCPRCGTAIQGKTEVATVQPELLDWHVPNNAGNWAETEQNATGIKARQRVKPQKVEKRELFAPRSGFTIAGSCIAAGMLILLFVFIMGSNLPPVDALSQKAHTQATIAPTPTLEPTAIPSPTPTASLSGQKYFDGAQLGSEINNSTAQIVTQTSSFTLNQKIFVTFQVHTGDQIGSACLLGIWGNHTQTHFEFPLESSTGAAYSYMPAAAKGAGRVEIYYASDTACTDEVLAQSIDFSVG